MSAIRRIRTGGKGIKQFGAWMTRMKIQSFLKNTRCPNNLSDEYFALQAKKEEIVEQYFYCFLGIFSCVSNIHIFNNQMNSKDRRGSKFTHFNDCSRR